MVVNILLPDRIYEYGSDGKRGKLVSPFTYDEGSNILTQSVEFLRFGAYQIMSSFHLLQEHEGTPFTWQKTPGNKVGAKSHEPIERDAGGGAE